MKTTFFTEYNLYSYSNDLETKTENNKIKGKNWNSGEKMKTKWLTLVAAFALASVNTSDCNLERLK
jgi:hypothetical protein